MAQTPPKAPKKSKPIFKRTTVIVALITTAGLVITAIIGGFFSLMVANRGSAPSSSTVPIIGTAPVSTASRPTPIPTPPLPTLRQHPALFSASTNIDTVTFALSVKPGDLIIVAITQWIGEVSSVTDNQDDTYLPVVKNAPYATPASSPDSSDGKNHDYAQLYYAKNVAGGTTTVTVKFTDSGDTNTGIYEFSGYDKLAPLDPKAVVFQTGTSQHLNGGTLKTTSDYELCFVIGVDDDGNNTPPMPGSQYHALVDHQDNADNERFYTEYLIASHGDYQTDFTIATDSHWVVVGAAFRP